MRVKWGENAILGYNPSRRQIHTHARTHTHAPRNKKRENV